MTEFVWLMDSQSAKCGEPLDQDPLNPTNNIVLEPQMSINRMLISVLELATIEIPRVQRLVEHCWNRLYLYGGSSNFCLQKPIRIVWQPRKKGESVILEAALPPKLNRIVRIEKKNKNNTFLFTTVVPHLLSTTDASCPDLLPEVIGLATGVIVGPFVVVSDTEFEASSNTFLSSSGAFLYTPPEPSPAYVARRITAQLRGFFEVVFDTCLSRFVFHMLPKARSLVSAAVLTIVPGTLDLGFTVGEHRFTEGDRGIVAAYTPAGTTFITLTSGNYVIEEMLMEINLRFNACFIPTGSILSISSARNGIQTIMVPEGAYTPITLCRTITQQLQLQGGVAASVVLTYHCGCYTFATSNPELAPFALEFQNPALTNIPYVLGFRQTRYTSESSYTSQDPVSAQATTCEDLTRFNVMIADAQQNLDATTLIFFFSAPAPLLNATLTMEGHLLRIEDASRALGVQLHDVVELQFVNQKSNEPTRLRFAVVEVVTGTEFLVQVGEEATLLEEILPLSCAVALAAKPTISIFTSPNNTQSIRPSILGFGTRDTLWRPNCAIQTPFTYQLNPLFEYILVEMVFPIGSSRIEHRWRSDHKTTILGKIIMSFEPQQVRFFPERVTFFTGTPLVKVHLRLLNRDHSPYQLHGAHWCATFRMWAEMSPDSLLTGVYQDKKPDLHSARFAGEE